MERAEEYRRKAEEAEILARRALSDVERAAYRKISEGWRQLEAAAQVSKRRGV